MSNEPKPRNEQPDGQTALAPPVTGNSAEQATSERIATEQPEPRAATTAPTNRPPAQAPALPPVTTPKLADRLASLAFRALIGLGGLLPYHRRIPFMGFVFSRILAPLAGWRRRIRANLALALPDLPQPEAARIIRDVPDNAGRAMAEIYSGTEFTRRITDADPLTGPGLPALREAAETGRPVILACAHFGNYDAMRAALAAKGWPVGALYRPMNNDAFNAHYVPAMQAIAEPIFPRGRAGLAAMLKFLRGGGWLALGFDQFDHAGAELRLFGLPSLTVLTPAELALRYDALVVPIAGVRAPDGLSFRVEVGAPVPHTEPRAMMQALNDDLERLIRAHPGQWFWVHRRWKNLERAPAPKAPTPPAH